MNYLYGEFSDEQISKNARLMHSEIHKLLLYKDNKVIEKIFESDEEFLCYFKNLLCRFGGLNRLLGEPEKMVSFMATLQAAYDACCEPEFHYMPFRRLIFDAHGYLTDMFGEVR